MHPIFFITSAEIKALNDTQARELVARLCKAELKHGGMKDAHVTWGGDQRANDGGVDVRVEMLSGVSIYGYVPRNSTIYQVKAEHFAKSKIPGEMAPNGVLRSAIVGLAGKSGAYIIVSTRDDLSDLSLSERKKSMADCLEGHGLIDRVFLDFYDSRRLADWAGSHPSIVTWLKNELGKPLAGWRPYEPWAYYEYSMDDEYLLDVKAKVRVPNAEEVFEAIDGINRLRGDLSKGGSSVRIVGLSGVGKTRLVQALFDDRIATVNPSLDPDNVLYSDLSDNPLPRPVAMLEVLILEGSESVVVIDNCGQDVHQRLTEIVRRPDSKIRLVTIEYDIRDNLPEGTACYHLEGSSDEVITSLLKRHFQNLSELDASKIVEFSDGNARVAFALASTSEIKGELAQLRDAELFERLFTQKNAVSYELQRCAEVASLLYSFDVEGNAKDSEVAILSEVAEVTIPTFYRNVSELLKRGLVQERGKWRAVLPHAISNRLALNAIESNHTRLLVQKFVIDASERVARSFSRRLGYLHESRHVQQIVEDWLKPEGFLGDVTSLSTHKWEMLENVSPVNQRAALNALLRAAENSEFTSTGNPNRACAARLLRSLAYEPELFDMAVPVLLKFALAELNDYKSDSVGNILQSLFYSHLSGTLASPERRAKLVRELAFSDDNAKQKLSLTLLRAGLESHHFSSHYSFDFGALKRSYGWYPRTFKEIQEWYRLFIRIAVDLGKTTTSLGSDARALLGSVFRALWSNARMQEALTDSAHELAAVDGWPDGWIGIRNTLHWDKERLDEISINQLNALERELAPRELLAQIKAKVLARGSFEIDLDDEYEQDNSESKSAISWYCKAQEEAEMLGKAAAFDADALADLTPYVSSVKSTNKSWYFGFGIGQAAASTQEIFNRIKQILPEIKKDGVNSIFIRGLVAGWNKVKPSEVTAFLDCALADEVWGEMFPELQVTLGIDAAAHSRLIKCMQIGKAPAWQFQSLGMGRATDQLSVDQIALLITPLSTKLDGGLFAAIDVLSMVIYCADNKTDQYKEELRKYCLMLLCELDLSLINHMNGNFWRTFERVIEFALESSESYQAATKFLNQLIQEGCSVKGALSHHLDNILLPFFKKYPIQTLDALYSKSKGDAFMHLLTGGIDRHGDTAVRVVTKEFLLDWCKVSPKDRCLFAARVCKLFERPDSGQYGDEAIKGISNTATAILALAPDKKSVLQNLVNRFQPSSWSGSLAIILRQRFSYLDDLNPTDSPELTTLIAEMKAHFLGVIQDEERREQEQSAIRSFE